MTARRLGAAAVFLMLAGCGSSGEERAPTPAAVPLVPGARIAAQVRTCDPGASAYCAIDFVVLDHRYQSSDVLAVDESKQLRKYGWSLANGDTGNETAANSPNHGLRVTYATASGDLTGIDLGWIKRPRSITLALSNATFDRDAAISMMLETGAS